MAPSLGQRERGGATRPGAVRRHGRKGRHLTPRIAPTAQTRRVLVGLGWAAAATAARAAFGLFAPSGPPLAFVFPAVLIATLQTGWLSGVVTLAAAEAAAWLLYLPQLRSPDLGQMSDPERLTLTLLISLALVVIAERYRALARRTAQAETAAAAAREEAYEESADRLRLLVHEIDHRANNLMTVIQGLVSLSDAPTAAELKQVIEGRLHALAKAHKLLSETRWSGADLQRLIGEELTPFGLGAGDRITAVGDNVALSAAAAQGFALALHELATNAVKYGALSNDAGEVRIDWFCEEGILKLSWRERGGPRVRKPSRSGTGLKVLQRAFEGGSGGRTRLAWAADGLTCRFEVPVDAQSAVRPGLVPAG